MSTTTLTPQTSRTYTIPASTSASAFTPQGNISVAAKSSADILDYTFDLTAWIGNTGDTILTPVTIFPPQIPDPYSVSAVWAEVNGNLVTLLLASGQPGMMAGLGILINTQQGRSIVIPISIIITNTSPPTLPPAAGQFPAGVIAVANTAGVLQPTLPAGFSTNGGIVVMQTSPGNTGSASGTPNFVSVSAESYSGDGSDLTIVINNRAVPLAQWASSIPLAGVKGDQGPPGPPGNPGTKGDQGVPGTQGNSIQFRGQWSQNTPYGVGDFVVSPSGYYPNATSLYGFVGTSHVTSSTPPAQDTSNWLEIRSQIGRAHV